MKIYEPNYTQVPNAVISLMPELKESELKVLLAIVRKTFGWQKNRDRISLSQLQEITGLGRASVSEAIHSDKFRGIVKVHKTKKGNEFEMIIHSMNSEPPKKEVVRNSNHSSSDSELSGSMNSEHTIKTITKETKQNKSESSFFDQIEEADTKPKLLEIWNTYRKSKGKHMNLYEREVLMKSTWKSKTVQQIKSSILYTIENGWFTLQEREVNNSESKPSYYQQL